LGPATGRVEPAGSRRLVTRRRAIFFCSGGGGPADQQAKQPALDLQPALGIVAFQRVQPDVPRDLLCQGEVWHIRGREVDHRGAVPAGQLA